MGSRKLFWRNHFRVSLLASVIVFSQSACNSSTTSDISSIPDLPTTISISTPTPTAPRTPTPTPTPTPRPTPALTAMTTFTGLVESDYYASAYSVAISRDQTFIVAAGEIDDAEGSKWAVKRYSGANFATVDTLENDFAIDGGTLAYAQSVSIAPDGLSVVAVGQATDAIGGQKWVVKRYSGTNFSTVETLENSFAVTGGNYGIAQSVSIAPDSLSIVVAGQAMDAGGSKWVVKRYSGTNFSTVDTLENDFAIVGGTYGGASSVSIASDGLSIAVAGQAMDGAGQKWVVKRYSGTHFATIDTLESDFAVVGGTAAYASSVNTASDGLSIVAAGRVHDTLGYRWVVKRYSGTNFATMNTLEYDTAIDGGTYADAKSVSIASDGLSLVATGVVVNADGGNNWVVKRYSGANFATVTTLKNSVMTDVDPTTLAAYSYAVALSPDGLTYVTAGELDLSTDAGNTWTFNWAVQAASINP